MLSQDVRLSFHSGCWDAKAAPHTYVVSTLATMFYFVRVWVNIRYATTVPAGGSTRQMEPLLSLSVS